MDLSWIPALVSAIGTIVAAYFAYNQYTKNKITDLKIANWKEQVDQKNAERTSNIARIYGELYEVLHTTKADRVVILQPHPLINSMYLSVSYEVKKNSIIGTKEFTQSFNMADFAESVGILANNDVLVYHDTEQDMEEGRSKGHVLMHGTKKMYIKRLSDNGERWIGSLIVGYTDKHKEVDLEVISKKVSEAALSIQYILPEYEIINYKVTVVP